MKVIQPSIISRPIRLVAGIALGVSEKWSGGCSCRILTPVGIVGCAIYNLEVAAEFDEAYAIAKGTPGMPLVEPEDLLEAALVGVSPKAAAFGVAAGMTGRQAAEQFLKAASNLQDDTPGETEPLH